MERISAGHAQAYAAYACGYAGADLKELQTDGSRLGHFQGGAAQDAVQFLRDALNCKFPEISFSFDTGEILTAALNFGLPSPINVQIEGNKLNVANGLCSSSFRGFGRATGPRMRSIETKFDNRESVILGMPCDKPLQPFEQIVGAARLRSEILTNLRRPGCPDIQYGNSAANVLKMSAGIFAPAHHRRRGVPFLVLAAVML